MYYSKIKNKNRNFFLLACALLSVFSLKAQDELMDALDAISETKPFL